MTTTQVDRPTKTPRPDGSWLGRAWFGVVLIPVFFVVAFALGYVLYDVFGYAAEDNDAPLWVDLVVALATVVVFLVPCAVAAVYGRRTMHAGDRRGLLPLALGAVAGVAMVVLTVVTTVADALR